MLNGELLYLVLYSKRGRNVAVCKGKQTRHKGRNYAVSLTCHLKMISQKESVKKDGRRENQWETGRGKKWPIGRTLSGVLLHNWVSMNNRIANLKYFHNRNIIKIWSNGNALDVSFGPLETEPRVYRWLLTAELHTRIPSKRAPCSCMYQLIILYAIIMNICRVSIKPQLGEKQ